MHVSMKKKRQGSLTESEMLRGRVLNELFPWLKTIMSNPDGVLVYDNAFTTLSLLCLKSSWTKHICFKI